MRIIFMGSPDFAVATLRALIDADHEIIRVYTQPPRPAGRGHRERPCPVHAEAISKNLPVCTPVTMTQDSAIAGFLGLDAHMAVVVAYGHILPVEILGSPEHGCINVHASLLPRWRGAAPIQRAIQAGDTRSGVSIMQMTAGLDAGPVYMTRAVELGRTITGGELHDTLARVGADACVDTLRDIAAGTANAVAQADTGVSYAHKLNTRESRIDWSRNADELERTIRAFDPWPRTWFESAGERINVLAAHVSADDVKHAAGTVVDGHPSVACGSGTLVLDRLQRAGRKAQDAGEFMRGYDLKVGTCLASA